jgi:Holliday junction resolvase RusA-like endonuclease
MNDEIICEFTIPIAPATKKNSQRIVMAHGRPFIMPSKLYKDYEKSAGFFIKNKNLNIDYPINLKAVYYMPTRRRVDLVNLLEATCDVLVAYKVVADDNSKVIASMDGSRVYYDKESPRAEITITKIFLKDYQ